MLLSSVIRAHLGELFPGREVEAFSQFRVTRDSDLEVDEDDVHQPAPGAAPGADARATSARRCGWRWSASCPTELSDFLLKQFELPRSALYRVNGPVNLVRLNAADRPGRCAARAALPAVRAGLAEAAAAARQSIFERLRQGDVLLHQPFESFEPVVQFLREAVERPGRAGDQADHLPHRRRVGADGPAARGGAARQGSDGAWWS